MGTSTIDPAHSSIGFSVRHLIGKVRGNDLRSVNVFDVDHHPDMTFESTRLTVHEGQLELPGKLPIRSITRDVAMEVEFLGLDETGLQGEQRIGISTTTTIRRSDCGVGAGAGAGDDQKIVVGDKITI